MGSIGLDVPSSHLPADLRTSRPRRQCQNSQTETDSPMVGIEVLRLKEVIDFPVDLCSKEPALVHGVGFPVGTGKINFR